jgi:hypothetical protein
MVQEGVWKRKKRKQRNSLDMTPIYTFSSSHRPAAFWHDEVEQDKTR